MSRIGRSGTVALGCLGAFVLLTLALLGGPLPHLDETVRHWAVTHQRSGVRRLSSDALWLGDARVAGSALLVVTAAVAARVRRLRLALLTLGLAGLLAVAVLVLKVVIGRAEAPTAPHPDLGAGGRGYPSGHVATATVCWGLAAAVIGAHVRQLRAAAAVAAVVAVLLTTWSVIYAPDHWVTDTVGGALLSAAAIAGWVALSGTRLSRRRRS